MRIGIDGRLSGIQNAGIGRYIEELVRELVRDKSVTWIIFLQHKNQLPWLKPQAGIEVVIAPVKHYSFAEQIFLPLIFSRAKLDLLHVPHFNVPLFYRKPLVITIHDLLWHDQRGASMTTLPKLIYSIKYLGYRLVTWEAARRAKVIIVPAHTVKKTLLKHMPRLESGKIQVTLEGVDAAWRLNSKIQVTNNKQKILFYTGSLYPHKNLLFVVRALRKMPSYKLFISSSRNVFVKKFLQEVEKLGMKTRVKYLGRLSDAELQAWYRKCLALVQPSLSEGFGLTGVEAMASGLPVLASDIDIFHEIYGEQFIAFNPHDETSFINALSRLDKQDFSPLIKKGMERAHLFSWEKMAKQTRKIYTDALQYASYAGQST